MSVRTARWPRKQHLARLRDPRGNDTVGWCDDRCIGDLLLDRGDHRFRGGALRAGSFDLLPTGPATSLSSCALAAATARSATSRRVAASSRDFRRRAALGEAGEAVEVAASRVELGLGLRELILGPTKSSARVPASSRRSWASAASALALPGPVGARHRWSRCGQPGRRQPRYRPLEGRLEEPAADLRRQADLGGFDVAGGVDGAVVDGLAAAGGDQQERVRKRSWMSFHVASPIRAAMPWSTDRREIANIGILPRSADFRVDLGNALAERGNGAENERRADQARCVMTGSVARSSIFDPIVRRPRTFPRTFTMRSRTSAAGSAGGGELAQHDPRVVGQVPQGPSDACDQSFQLFVLKYRSPGPRRAPFPCDRSCGPRRRCRAPVCCRRGSRASLY